MSNIGYKVLSPGRRSAIASNLPSSIYYPKGKKVTHQQNCGPLCVFDTYDNALNLYSIRSTLMIVKCKYEESIERKIWDQTN